MDIEYTNSALQCLLQHNILGTQFYSSYYSVPPICFHTSFSSSTFTSLCTVSAQGVTFLNDPLILIRNFNFVFKVVLYPCWDSCVASTWHHWKDQKIHFICVCKLGWGSCDWASNPFIKIILTWNLTSGLGTNFFLLL